MTRASGLHDVVTAAAADLTAATAASYAATSERVIADLVNRFNVDRGFLRRTDHTIRATVLVAAWPPRENLPDPDPLAVVYYADADPVFGLTENLKAPSVLRPEPANANYQRYIEETAGIPTHSLACVPLISGDVTTGTLGFVKFGDREWLPEELSALQTIATLFAALQARLVAEEQLHYLAEHDELTGLCNRNALVAHLDARLADGQPGPVSALYLDVDRLKVLVDHLEHDALDRFITAFTWFLREAVDIPAFIARVAGDEFCVVLAEPMDVDGAKTFAQRLQKRVHQQVVIDGQTLTRTVSIGVATGLPGRDSASELLRRVHRATL
jgi:diguanylate cyclase (GGDEF)-like protein